MATQFFLNNQELMNLMAVYETSKDPLGIVITTGVDDGENGQARIFGLEGSLTSYEEIPGTSQVPCPYPPPCKPGS